MKYIKNPEVLLITLILFLAFIFSFCVFLDILPTGAELTLHEFNSKTASVIGMLIFGFLTWATTKIENI